LALPSADTQLCVVEIALTSSVYAWVGESSPLFDRPGGMSQVYLPNLTRAAQFASRAAEFASRGMGVTAPPARRVADAEC